MGLQLHNASKVDIFIAHSNIFLPVCVTWGPFSAHFSNDRLHIGNVSLNDPLIFPNYVMSCYPLLYIWNTLHLPCLETCFLFEACSASHTMSSDREGSSILWLMNFHIISPLYNLFWNLLKLAFQISGFFTHPFRT